MSFETMIEHSVIKPYTKLRKISEPLSRIFGIEHFWISKTSANGTHTTIGGYPELHNHYFSTDSFVYSPFFRNPSLVSPGVYLYKNISDQEFQKRIKFLIEKTNIELCIGLAYKRGEDLIRFGYGVKPEFATQKSQLILNNLPLLTQFNQHFLIEAKDIISNAEKFSVNLAQLNPSYNLVSNLKTSLGKEEQIKFLKAIKGEKQMKILSLSAKEKTCLKYVFKGFTAPQIAQALELSERTIEHYMESIKNKLDCHSKSELFDYASFLENISDI